jgi:cation transport regulator ChaC
MSESPLWIFGYGSLVWRPAFDYVEKRRAVVDGWARRFWQASPDHRGTPEQPGRVVTMLRWPSQNCVGMAYAIHEANREAVLEQLDMREIAGYERVQVPVRASLNDLPFATATAWVATTSNANFVGLAPIEDMAEQIRQARGQSGTNREYVFELAKALRTLGASEEDQAFTLAKLLETP